MLSLSISLTFEIIALLTAVTFFFLNRNRLILYFIPFLLITVIIESIGRWGSFDKSAPINKFGLYNLFTASEFIFYASIFYTEFTKTFFRKFVLLFIPLYLVAVAVNFAFVQGLNNTFHSYTFLLGSFFIVVFCCWYFYESVLPARIDKRLSKQPFFWVASGLLIFYLGSVIINALYQYLLNNDLRSEGIKIYNLINRSLNVILYSSFCIAFYVCPTSKKTYSSPS